MDDKLTIFVHLKMSFISPHFCWQCWVHAILNWLLLSFRVLRCLFRFSQDSVAAIENSLYYYLLGNLYFLPVLLRSSVCRGVPQFHKGVFNTEYPLTYSHLALLSFWNFYHFLSQTEFLLHSRQLIHICIPI